MEALLNEAIVVAGSLAVVINLVLQVAKQYISNKDYVPIIASVGGIVIGLLFGWYLSADLFLYGLAGFLGGLGSIGLHETGDKATKGVK